MQVDFVDMSTDSYSVQVASIKYGGHELLHMKTGTQHTSAYVSIRQHTSAYVSIRAPAYEDRYSAYLTYWYKSTNTDAAAHLLLCMKTETGMPEQTGTFFFFQKLECLSKQVLSCCFFAFLAQKSKY
jgi:hypothetical protein